MHIQNWKKNLHQTIIMISLWMAGVALVACGGGDLLSVAPGLGSGGTGSVAGTLTGLGSVIVDGVRYDDSAAVLERQSDLVQSETLSLSDLQVGQYAYLSLDAAGNPTRVQLESQLVGPVGGVNAARGQMTIWGQTVGINTDASQGPVTVFSGYSGLADVTPLDAVQVYGVLQVDPSDASRDLIRATRIERLVSSSTLPARLTGTLRANGAALELARVPLATTNIINLSTSQPLQAGLVVTVVVPWPSSPSVLPSTWQATSLRVLGIGSTTVSALRLSGAAQIQSDGLVTIQGVLVNISDPSLATLRAAVTNGTYITVMGQFSQSTGQLKASTLELTPAGGRPMELHGSVTSWVNSQSFMVRGMRINAENALWLGGTAANLSNGHYVDVTGNLIGNVFNANKVVLQAVLPEKAVLDVTGLVQAIDSNSRQARMLTQDGETLNVAIGSTETLPSVGNTIRVEGFWQNGVLLSRELSSLTPADQSLIRLEGIVDAIGTGQFRLNGLQIWVDASLFATLRVSQGERVEVLVRLSDNRYNLVEFKSKSLRR